MNNFDNAPPSSSQDANAQTQPASHSAPGIDDRKEAVQRMSPKASKDIPVDLYHQVVLLPFRIREVVSDQKPENGNSPAPTPLDRWVESALSGGLWSEADTKFKDGSPARFFPLDQMGLHHADENAPFSNDATYARLRYAEYAYFHPFVRSFLYPTAEDLYHHKRQQQEKTIHHQNSRREFTNRSLRVLKRNDVQWAEVSVRDTLAENNRAVSDAQQRKEVGGADSLAANAPPRPEFRTYLLRVRRMELYLFETRIGFLVVEFDTRKGPHSNPDLWKQFPVESNEKQCRPPDIAMGAREDNTKSCFETAPEETPLNLSDVLLLQDSLRRCYVPYWEFDPLKYAENGPDSKDCLKPGHVVESLTWLDGTRNGVPGSDDALKASQWSQLLKKCRESGEPELFPWWSSLLEPLKPLGARGSRTEFSAEECWLDQQLKHDVRLRDNAQANHAQTDHAGVYYKALGDDRLPCLTYVATPEPRTISDADWLRLAVADPPGNRDQLEYSPGLYTPTGIPGVATQQAFQQFAYDRFYNPGDPKKDQSVTDYHQTRFLCSGLVFVAVGSSQVNRKYLMNGANYSVKPFALDPVNGLLAHFRYHYFKLGLIALFHRFSLLNFEDELSIAASEELGKDYGSSLEKNESDENFKHMVVRLRREVVRFRFRFWFTEVSTQMQGQELFELWSRHLKTSQLFEQVNEQINEAEEVLDRWEQQANARQQGKNQRLAEERNLLFHVLAYIGIPLTFFGFYKDLQFDLLGLAPPFWAILLTAGTTAVAGLEWSVWQKRKTQQPDSDQPHEASIPIWKILPWTIGWLIAVACLSVLLMFVCAVPSDPPPTDKDAVRGTINIDEEAGQSPLDETPEPSADGAPATSQATDIPSPQIPAVDDPSSSAVPDTSPK